MSRAIRAQRQGRRPRLGDLRPRQTLDLGQCGLAQAIPPAPGGGSRTTSEVGGMRTTITSQTDKARALLTLR